MEKVYLSLGSNIGDSFSYLFQAIGLIRDVDRKITAISPAYKTEPWGKTDQNSFLNCAVELETDISPWKLKSIFKEIEKTLGKNIIQRWGERTIDIDIIFYGQKIIYEKKLIIPHPRFQLRNFVLIPLCDISYYIVDPISKLTTGELLEICEDNSELEYYGVI